jgi:predicted DNA-binding transcriptional regulator AlpA
MAAKSIQSPTKRVKRFGQLKAEGIVDSRATLNRWMSDAVDPFPQPLVLSPNMIGWLSDEVDAWLARHPRGKAPQPSRIQAQRRAKAA